MKNEVSENFISDYDKEIKEIADYTVNFSSFSDLSRQTAYYVLLDSIACGILALKNESCKNLLDGLDWLPDWPWATGCARTKQSAEYCLSRR